MSTEQITVRLPQEYVDQLRCNAKEARRSLAAEITMMLDQSPLRIAVRQGLPAPPKRDVPLSEALAELQEVMDNQPEAK